ncbi:hypothetical protein [Neobacillus sp. NPDC093127]|uniref:hypothetical protein n=1 Tax=Neobacillus sp. NPDC093127 TaxID=3364296 RepID=UPI00380E2113
MVMQILWKFWSNRKYFIHKTEVSCYLDSKSYYQPVYAFQSTVDGIDMSILIPGI